MENSIVVRGRLVTPSLVELSEPLKGVTDEVEVVAHPQPPVSGAQSAIMDLVRRLRSRPPGIRTKEDIDRQVEEERSSWDDR